MCSFKPKSSNFKIKEIDKSLESNTGIGHTRWATHGGVTLNNCHPHTCNSVTLVHNGIIENYLSLKKILLDKGYSFYGETDTEVLAGYIDYCYKETKDKVLAIDKAIKSITGSYALGIIFNDETDTIYATRKDSPLIVGLSADGNFIASDMPAIAKYTNKYFLLNAGDIVTLHKFSYTVTNNNDIPVKFSVDGGTTWTNDLADVAASDSTKLAANSGTTTIKVQWKWDFNGSDDSFDTALGIGGNAVLTVKAEVTATQVD